MFNQRWLDYEFFEKHEVHVTRRALAELAISASLDPSTHALASDKTTGKLNRITITNDKGRLPKEEIERMVNETEIQATVARVQVTNTFKTYVYNPTAQSTRRSLQQFDPADKSKLTSAVSVAISWLDASQEDSFTNCLGINCSSSHAVPYPKSSPTTITYYHCLVLLLRLSCPSSPTQASSYISRSSTCRVLLYP